MRYLALLGILLSGCSVPSVVLPVIGKPHIGNVTHNVYNAPVTQARTPWEIYFWATILIAALIFTPLGGMLISRLRKYKAAFTQTARAIEEAGDPGLKQELSYRHTDRTKDLVRSMKAKGQI